MIILSAMNDFLLWYDVHGIRTVVINGKDMGRYQNTHTKISKIGTLKKVFKLTSDTSTEKYGNHELVLYEDLPLAVLLIDTVLSCI